MTTIYICRHSTPFKEHRGKENISMDFLMWNKMSPLSVEGEKRAERLSENLKDIDVVWSSDYVRAMSTAKYVAQKNNIKVNIDERLGERIHGIIPPNLNIEEYEVNQLRDKNHKLKDGENQAEVSERITECINEIIKENYGKNIFICSHSTAITFFLLNYCTLNFNTRELLYKNKKVFDFNWNTPELFKLTYAEDYKIISIENIKI